MSTFEDQIRAIVRDELARLKAEIEQPAEFLSPQEAARVASVAEGTIRRWVREGKLERHTAGAHVRVRRADLERFLSSPARSTSNDNETAEQTVARLMR